MTVVLDPKNHRNQPETADIVHASMATNPDVDDYDLNLNTNFDFSSLFSNNQQQSADGRRNKAVSDHVLENGERVVVVDPNISDDEGNGEEELRAPSTSSKRSDSPASLNLLASRRKPETPLKRPRVVDVDSGPSRKMGRNASTPSITDSGVISNDEQGSSANNVSVPAPLLKLLLTAAAGGEVDNADLAELLVQSPDLLQTLGESLPSCSKSTPKETKDTEESTTLDANTLAKLSALSSAEQITTALALWPNATVGDLANRAFALGNNKKLVKKEQSSEVAKTNPSPQSDVDRRPKPVLKQEPQDDSNTNWLDLFKNEPAEPLVVRAMPRVTPVKKRSDSAHLQLKSSESVLSQLRSLKGEACAELEELEQFAQNFKRQRIKHGFTQGDVGVALGRRYGTDFSQTTISRFEALNLSFKNMCKLRPLMEEWMNEAESAIERGATVTDIVEADLITTYQDQMDSDEADLKQLAEHLSKVRKISEIVHFSKVFKMSEVFESSSPDRYSPVLNMSGQSLSNVLPQLKKRRKRTNLDTRQKDALDSYFIQNSRPDHGRMAEIGNELDLDPDVVRVWFCNRRQKLRKVI